MFPLIVEKTIYEADQEGEEKVIDQLCQYHTDKYPFIRKEKFKYETVGDLIRIQYKIQATESQIMAKLKAFSEAGYVIWNNEHNILYYKAGIV